MSDVAAASAAPTAAPAEGAAPAAPPPAPAAAETAPVTGGIGKARLPEPPPPRRPNLSRSAVLREAIAAHPAPPSEEVTQAQPQATAATSGLASSPEATPGAEPVAASEPALERPAVTETDLRRREVELHRRDRELRARARQYEQQAAAVAELERARAGGDPDAALRALGFDTRRYQEHLIMRAMRDGPPAQPTAEQLAVDEAVKPYAERFEQMQREVQQREHQAQFSHYLASEIAPIVVDADKYEALHAWHGRTGEGGQANVREMSELVARARAEHHQIHGEWMPVRQVVDLLERHYRKQITDGYKAAQRFKFTQNGGPAPKKAAAPPAPTLTASMRPTGASAPANAPQLARRGRRAAFLAEAMAKSRGGG